MTAALEMKTAGGALTAGAMASNGGAGRRVTEAKATKTAAVMVIVKVTLC